MKKNNRVANGLPHPQLKPPKLAQGLLRVLVTEEPFDVKRQPTILIADRNPHVRKFLQREMISAGYQVRLAENCRQVIFWTHHHGAVDLLILDPDLPDMDIHALFSKLRYRTPDLPVLVHSHANEELATLTGEGVWFVEKRGNSIEGIKQMVNQIIGSGAY